jgi:hypothetical protein
LNRVFSCDICYTIFNRICYNPLIGGFENVNWFVKCDGGIRNGVTYNRKYSGKSYIDLYENNSELEDSTDITISALSDFSGVTSANSWQMVTLLSGMTSYQYNEDMTELNYVDTDYSYSITEGYPLYKHTTNQTTTYSAVKTDYYNTRYANAYLYENVVDTLSLDMGGNFYDNVCYTSASTVTFGGIGNADNDIEYYCLSKGYTSVFSATEGLIAAQPGQNGDILLAVVYLVNGTRHHVGEVGFLKILRFLFVVCEIEYEDANGNVKTITVQFTPSDQNNVTDADMLLLVETAISDIAQAEGVDLFSAKPYKLLAHIDIKSMYTRIQDCEWQRNYIAKL